MAVVVVAPFSVVDAGVCPATPPKGPAPQPVPPIVVF